MAAEFGRQPHAFDSGLHFGWDVAKEVERPGLGNLQKARKMRPCGLLQVETDGVGIRELVADINRALLFGNIDLRRQGAGLIMAWVTPL